VKDIRPGDVWLEDDGDYFWVFDAYDADDGAWEGHAFYNQSQVFDNGADWEGTLGCVRQSRFLVELIYRQYEDVTDEYDRVLERQGGFYGVDEGFVTKDSGVRAAYDSGMVRDTQEGKPRFDLMYPKNIPYKDQFFTRYAELLARGITKYGERNWELANSQDEVDRFIGSAERHLKQWMTGETDEDHGAAVVFNIMAAESTKWKMLNANSND
jgi:hypothetical protein